MKLIEEVSIRKIVDSSTIAMLDLWKELTIKKFGKAPEVIIGDRKEHPQLKSFVGSINLSYPHKVKGKVYLALWLDSVDPLNLLMVTHELGHWILKLQNFLGLLSYPKKNNNIEILLNSLAHHVPLYELQKKYGHEPQIEIDSRASHNLNLFSKDEEPYDNNTCKQSALILADDIINCSPNIADQIKSLFSKKHPKTYKMVDTILETKSYYNLQIPEKNLKFQKMVIKKLALPNSWEVGKDVDELSKMIEK